MRLRTRYALWTSLLAVALFLPTAFGRSSVVWFCEGRICTTSALSCCCEAPFGKDTNCVTQPNRSVDDSSLCAAQCGCESVIIADADPNTPPLTPSPILFPDFVSVPVLAPLPTPATGFAYRVPLFAGTRAPPLSKVVSSRSLRAPPAFLSRVVIATNV
ncbi:MAG: hypothetical protein H8F28_14405 [Fibrella sp.]|nr:hypothetical protein [Armatimonadota bacterium]